MFDDVYLLRVLTELCQTPSPTGFTAEAITYVEVEFERLGVPVARSRKGALVATLPGPPGAEPRCLAAHVDTLGAMVKEIKPSGRLRLTQVGGYAWGTVEGEHCLVHTEAGDAISGTIMTTKPSVHVWGGETRTQAREDATMELRLDERVMSAADVAALGIQVGDFVSLDPRTLVLDNGFIKSRHLDNKAGTAILLALAKAVVEGKIALAAPTHLFISNYEEVGHGASAGIPLDVAELVAVDMAAIGEGQTSDEFSVTICVKDSTGPYDYELSRRLQRLARAAGLDYKVDIYPNYGSDASAALRAGLEARAALVGPGIDASHAFERTHIDSLLATCRLLLEYVKA